MVLSFPFSFLFFTPLGWCQQRPPVVRGAAAGSQVLSGWAQHWPVRGWHHESQHGGHLWDPREGLGHTELHAGGYEGMCCPLLVGLNETALFDLFIYLTSWILPASRLSLVSMWRPKRWCWLTWLTTIRGGCGQQEIEANRRISRSGLFHCIHWLMFCFFKSCIKINLQCSCLHFLGVPRP